jgi:predicted chitinase
MITTLVFGEDDMPALLAAAMPGSARANREKYGPELLRTAWFWKISTPLRFAHWLAQLAHESGQLKYSEEIASGRAYEGRKSLGNIYPGDGVKFKGHGLIQITGRNNHQRYATAVNDAQIMETPDLLAKDPYYAVDSAGWYWVKGAGVDLNRIADKDNIVLITKLINGGYNGLADRKKFFVLCRRAVWTQGALKVQRALNAMSDNGARWPILVDDGTFGPQTTSVVREMQADYLIKPDGIVGPKTWNILGEFA